MNRKTPEEIFDEAISAHGLDVVSVKDADLYEAGLYAINQALTMNKRDIFIDVLGQVFSYIENEAEIAIPVDELMHKSGRNLTKNEYGHVLLKYLLIELREHFN